MKIGIFRLALLSAITLVAFITPLTAGALHAAPTCFQPMEASEQVCIDFTRTWYMTTVDSVYVELRVRDLNASAESHVWNRGQYQLSHLEFEKLKAALAGQGLSASCPHSAFRRSVNAALAREEYCR